MNKIKPYLFWIVIGVLSLAALIAGFVMEPTNEKGKTAAEAKKSFDREFTRLKREGKKARREPPARYAPSQLEELDKEYMITAKWENGLRSVLNGYKEQRSQLRDDLLRRSRLFEKPVSESNAPDAWYLTYRTESGDLLENLAKDGLLDSSRNIRNDDSVDFDDDQNLRGQFGLYTKGREYPDPSAHEFLSQRYQIISHLAQLCRDTTVTPDANPVQKDWIGEVQAERARFAGLEWEAGEIRSRAGEEVESPLRISVKGGEAIECSVTISGGVSAILEYTRKLELANAPIVIVKGAEWSLPNRNNSRSRQGTTMAATDVQADGVIECTLHLAFIRYTAVGLGE